MSDETTPVEETLAWEAEHRRTASAGAVVGGLVLLIGVFAQAAALSNVPQVPLLTALRHANSIAQSDLRTPVYHFLLERSSSLLFGAAMTGGGYAVSILGLGFLFRATRARRPELRRWVLYVLLIGLGLLAVTTIVQQVAQLTHAHSYVHGHDFSHDAAQAVVSSNSLNQGASYLSFFAALLSAVGTVLLSLNAMRSGLLTKFVGTLGIISGVAFVLAFGGGLLIFVFVIWLLCVGVLIGGHWPGGAPPAWASGKAEPWPTAQEVREAREAAKGGGGRGSSPRGGRASKPAPATTSTTEALPAGAPTPAPHPSSKKRKRKRR